MNTPNAACLETPLPPTKGATRRAFVGEIERARALAFLVQRTSDRPFFPAWPAANESFALEHASHALRQAYLADRFTAIAKRIAARWNARRERLDHERASHGQVIPLPPPHSR